MSKEKKWFELQDQIRKDPTRQVWTSLWEFSKPLEAGQRGYEGYVVENICTVCIAYPVDAKDDVAKIDWNYVVPGFGHGPNRDRDNYICTGIENGFCVEGKEGVYLALQQLFDSGETQEIHLNQDLEFALRLLRKGDDWIDPMRDDNIVVKIERDSTLYPISLKIRTEYLRDYLSARGMGAAICQYIDREEISKSDNGYYEDDLNLEEDGYKLSCSTQEIHEGGDPFGKKMAVFKVTRKNTDYSEDLPSIKEESQEDIEAESLEKPFEGEKLFRTLGRLWINKWLPPADVSSFVLFEEPQSGAYFVTDIEGNKLPGNELQQCDGWLWFRPDLILEIQKRKKSYLQWYTKETGGISFNRCEGFHFGVNDAGLINVLAVDIGKLDEYHRKIVAGYNIVPEGGVSKELMMSQKDGEPAGTYAAEYLLLKSLKCLDVACSEKSLEFLRMHEKTDDILRNIHRFRALSEQGLYELANDLNRIFLERLDKSAVVRCTPEDKRHPDKKIGSLKALETLITAFGGDGRKCTAPLVGCYELRHGVSHLPSEDIKDAYKLADLDPGSTVYHIEGEKLILNVACTIGGFSNFVRACL